MIDYRLSEVLSSANFLPVQSGIGMKKRADARTNPVQYWNALVSDCDALCRNANAGSIILDARVPTAQLFQFYNPWKTRGARNQGQRKKLFQVILEMVKGGGYKMRAVFRIHIDITRIRIQHFRSMQIWMRIQIQGFDDQKL